MRFASLGSGSRGNATLIEAGDTRVLVDCGFSVRETGRRLQRLGVESDDLSAIVATHEHSDHMAGVASLARRHRLPVWATYGTAMAADLDGLPGLRVFHCHETLELGDLCIQPYTVPHDAREPAQFVFTDGAQRLGMLTDAGHVTDHIRSVLSDCDALLLETNHDPGMLANGPYHAALKRRVGSDYGHLSNGQAAELLNALPAQRLRHVVAAHLSEQNNRPELARAALAESLGCEPGWIALIDQQEGLDWRDLR